MATSARFTAVVQPIAGRLARVRACAGEPEPALGAEWFRILFGVVLLGSTVRFVGKGWVQEFYAAPSQHFPFEGFEWLAPWPAPWLDLHFAVIALSAAGIALGLFYRASAIAFCLSFTCVELWDKTYYLNHYYLVSVLALWLCMMPLGRCASLDAWRKKRARATQPRWVRAALRAQLMIVYGYAGLAKLDADWLLRGEPLATWLRVHADVPVIGGLLVLPEAAIALSWAGALFDLAIGPLLLFRRTRPFAYAAVVLFHGTTGLLLPIGLFPVMMIAFTTVFFAPDWPARLVERLRRPRPSAPGMSDAKTAHVERVGPALATLVAALLALQLLLPLRHAFYPGPVNWTEEGFRFAWRVMLIEKTGSVEFELLEPVSGRRFLHNPRRRLTDRQYRMMATQPDMIRQYARQLARAYRAEGGAPLQIHADAWASLNGRPACRLIAADADLLDPNADWRTSPACQRAPQGSVVGLARR